jgi:hypothetical protein
MNTVKLIKNISGVKNNYNTRLNVVYWIISFTTPLLPPNRTALDDRLDPLIPQQNNVYEKNAFLCVDSPPSVSHIANRTRGGESTHKKCICSYTLFCRGINGSRQSSSAVRFVWGGGGQSCKRDNTVLHNSLNV